MTALRRSRFRNCPHEVIDDEVSEGADRFGDLMRLARFYLTDCIERELAFGVLWEAVELNPHSSEAWSALADLMNSYPSLDNSLDDETWRLMAEDARHNARVLRARDESAGNS